jgi:hypothetical protein
MQAMDKTRTLERGEFKAEFIGSTTKLRLWINGRLYGTFKSLATARAAFNSYVQRHSA